tara:strand:+ start:630 stop:929 length:300 start_codon:yes stop_codon:yes gene_type:complete
MSELRFDRVEQSLGDLVKKVDEMSKLMTAVIRMEEKNIAIQQRLDTLDVRANKHSEELDSILVVLSEVKNRGQFNEWFIRGLIASMVGGIAIVLNTAKF